MAWPFIPIWLVLALSLYLFWRTRSLLTAASTALSLLASLATINQIFDWLWGLKIGPIVLNEYSVLFLMMGATALSAVLDAAALLMLRRYTKPDNQIK